jgi:hypothetical protein
MVLLWVKLSVLAIFLLVHGIASWRKWYYKKPEIDMLTHFLGGLALSAFLKDMQIAFALIVAWEILEVLLIKEGKKAFREKPLNKLRDVAMGMIGYIVGLDTL